MAFYFKNFPTVQYNMLNQGALFTVTNPLVRFKIHEAIKNRIGVYYDHVVRDGERADVIAKKYYEDETLDWIIWLANDIVDPHFDWPLDYSSLINFIKNKYGSTNIAQTTVDHYEKIIRKQSVTFDGIIIPEKVVNVDIETYNSLDLDGRKIKYAYEHEVELNDNKRKIVVLQKDYISKLQSEAESIFA
jgi:hypothetical protein